MWYLLIKVLFRFNYFWRPYSSFKQFIFKFFNNFLQKNEKSSCSVLLINTNIRCLNQAGTVSWSVWCESGHVCDTGSRPVFLTDLHLCRARNRRHDWGLLKCTRSDLRISSDLSDHPSNHMTDVRCLCWDVGANPSF